MVEIMNNAAENKRGTEGQKRAADIPSGIGKGAVYV